MPRGRLAGPSSSLPPISEDLDAMACDFLDAAFTEALANSRREAEEAEEQDVQSESGTSVQDAAPDAGAGSETVAGAPRQGEAEACMGQLLEVGLVDRVVLLEQALSKWADRGCAQYAQVSQQVEELRGFYCDLEARLTAQVAGLHGHCSSLHGDEAPSATGPRQGELQASASERFEQRLDAFHQECMSWRQEIANHIVQASIQQSTDLERFQRELDEQVARRLQGMSISFRLDPQECSSTSAAQGEPRRHTPRSPRHWPQLRSPSRGEGDVACQRPGVELECATEPEAPNRDSDCSTQTEQLQDRTPRSAAKAEGGASLLEMKVKQWEHRIFPHVYREQSPSPRSASSGPYSSAAAPAAEGRGAAAYWASQAWRGAGEGAGPGGVASSDRLATPHAAPPSARRPTSACAMRRHYPGAARANPGPAGARADTSSCAAPVAMVGVAGTGLAAARASRRPPHS